MKHFDLGAYFACFVFLVLAGIVVWLNRAAFNGMPLYCACGLVIIAVACAVPATLGKASASAKELVGVINAARKGE